MNKINIRTIVAIPIAIIGYFLSEYLYIEVFRNCSLFIINVVYLIYDLVATIIDLNKNKDDKKFKKAAIINLVVMLVIFPIGYEVIIGIVSKSIFPISFVTMLLKAI